jgi:sec-independent protein translocase protein TatC
MTKPTHHYELDDDREETQDPAAARMGFLDHLEELRTRLVRSLIAIAVGVVIAFSFVDRVADFVLAPAYRMLPPGSTLIFTKPGEALAFNLDIALIAGFVLAAPVVMYQVWRSPRCGL